MASTLQTPEAANSAPAIPPPNAPVEVERWAPAFAEQEARGTFVLYREASAEVQVHDAAEASVLRLPASTFKVANALIALDLGVVGRGEVFEWDLVRRGGAWDQDQTLAMAFESSTVWVFEEIALRIGDRMASYLSELGYGNADTRGGPRFWLDGELRISALGQVDFLRRLAQAELPVSAEARRVVLEMMLMDASPAQTLRAKTGWARTPEGDLGWIVGWVEQDGERSFFALAVRADGPEFEMRKARREVLQAILRQEGLAPEN